jgi:RNA-binding protein YlmH
MDYLRRSWNVRGLFQTRRFHEWTVGAEVESRNESWKGLRLERYLTEHAGLSRNLIYKLIRKKQISINGQPSNEGIERIGEGDKIRIVGQIKIDMGDNDEVEAQEESFHHTQRSLCPQQVGLFI